MKPNRRERSGGHGNLPSAVILDWSTAFAAKVMARIHEYDDNWPKPSHPGTIIRLDRGSDTSGNQKR